MLLIVQRMNDGFIIVFICCSDQRKGTADPYTMTA